MPNSTGSHDSHFSVSESLPSLSDQASTRSSRSAQSSSSSSSAHWHTRLDSYVPFTAPTLGKTASQSAGKLEKVDVHPNATIKQSSARTVPPSAFEVMGLLSRSDASIPASTPSHQQQLQRTQRLPRSHIEAHKQAANYASLAPPITNSMHHQATYPSASGTFAATTPNVDDVAPRLSISSADSSSTSDLATPENQHQAWPYDDENAYATAQSLSHLPSKEQIQSLESQSERIVADREDRAASRTHLSQQPATSVDRLVLQRPAKLERLSSSATTATAKPSSPPSATTPDTAIEARFDTRLPDVSALRVTSDLSNGDSVHTDEIGWKAGPSSAPHSPANESTSRFAANLHAGPRQGLSSPDSWRSLLPEHDPYFASEGQLRAHASLRSASPQSLQQSSSSLADVDAYIAARSSGFGYSDHASISSQDTGRTSFSSAMSGFSAMSLPGPKAVGTSSPGNHISDSWRSLLPDSDRYHVARATGVDEMSLDGYASLQNRYSPSFSDRFESLACSDGSSHRSAFLALNPRLNMANETDSLDAAARRHGSFSSVEPGTSSQYDTRHALSKMRDGTSTRARPSTSSHDSRATGQSPSVVTGAQGSMASPMSQASFEDMSERESWPTSRLRSTSSAASPVSHGPWTPEAQHVMPLVMSNDGKVHGSFHPARVAETTDSLVEATSEGAPATTSTTTTKLTIPEPHDTSDQQDGQDQGTVGPDTPEKPRTSSCSVSTPISPPALPFLERRPAPPETDLVIETHKTKYTLVTNLPGFSLDCITLATKKQSQHRTLHIVADKWDCESGGHFERRITFPDKECDLRNVKAEFDGTTLRVDVPRITSSNRFSSASSATF